MELSRQRNWLAEPVRATREFLSRINGKIEVWGLARVYVCLALLFGTVLIFLLPPYQVADSEAHVFRSYQIAEGQLLSPVVSADYGGRMYHLFTAQVPASLLPKDDISIPIRRGYRRADLHDFMKTPLEPHVVMDVYIANTGSYAPVAYAPQALAARLAMELGASLGGVYYAMRFAALLVTVFCFGLAIRLLPEKRLLLFLMGMMPMVLAQGASESADAMIHGTCILMGAWLLSLRREKTQLCRRELVLLLFGAVLLGLLKQVYAAILLIYFLLPMSRLGGRRRFWLFGVLLLATALGASALWLQLDVVRNSATLDFGSGANAVLQMQGILSDPLRFLQRMGETIFLRAHFWLDSCIGVLGWLTVPFPQGFVIGYALLLLLGSLFGRLELRLRLRQRALMMGIFLLVAVSLLIVFYLNWSAVGSVYIEGVQGRYFIPVLLLALSSFSVFRSLRYESLLAVSAGLISGIMMLSVVYEHFY